MLGSDFSEQTIQYHGALYNTYSAKLISFHRYFRKMVIIFSLLPFYTTYVIPLDNTDMISQKI